MTTLKDLIKNSTATTQTTQTTISDSVPTAKKSLKDLINQTPQSTGITKVITKTPTKTKVPSKTAGLTLKQRMAMENMEEPYSFGAKLKSDVGDFMTSIPKIPLALWDTMKKDLEKTDNYDTSKPFWKQGEGYNVFTNQESRDKYLKNIGLGALSAGVPGYKFLETIAHAPYVENTKFGKAIPKTPISNMANSLLLDSMIKNTGKWIYNPEAKTRKWFTPVSDPTSRAQDYKDRPFTSALEDISNVSILAAPIMKATGLSAKLSSAVKSTRPFKALDSKVLTPLNQRSKLLDIVSDMKQKTHAGLEELRTGKLMESLKGVSKENQAELQALIQKRASLLKPIENDYRYIKGTNELQNALQTYEKSASIESNSLIKRGLLKEGVQENAVWKDLTTEFGKSIDELKALGIDDPVYYPHTFEKYNVSGYPKLRQKKANYLKTKQGVTSVEGKGIEEPIISIPKHKVEYIVQKTVGQALKEVETQFGKPIVNGEILPGYSAWNPKQFNLEFYPIEGRAIGSQGALKPLVTVKKFQPKLQIPKFLNDEIVRMVTPMTGIAKTVGAVWDKATNSWKISVLALSPRWVFNNIMGNTMLNVLAGVVNPASYIEAGKRLIKGSRQAKTQGISFARAMSRQHIPEGAWEGLYRAEARAATPGKGGSWLVNDAAPVTGMWKKLGYKLSEVPKAMYNFNSAIESFYRTAHYIDKINAGLNPVKALASVNEFLFNYSKLSVMEKAIARRIVPFYAWQKNITRLLATYPFKHSTGTVVLGKLDKIAQEAQADDESKDFLPDWFKSYIKTPIKNEQGENLYASTRGINPFADIGALSGDALSYLSGINPMLKIPLERMLKMSLYKGKQFTSPNADIISGETENPPLWRHILSNFPQFTTIENMARPYSKYDTGEPMLDKEGKLKSEKSRLLEALKLLGINLTPYNEDELKQTEVERLMRAETIKKNYAEKLRKNQQLNQQLNQQTRQ